MHFKTLIKLKKHKSTFHKLDFNPQTKRPTEPLVASSKISKDVGKNPKLKIKIFKCEKCELAFNNEYMLKIHQLLDLRCVDSPAQARFQKVHEEKSPVAGIQINPIFNIDIDIAIFQKINIDIDIARAIYC